MLTDILLANIERTKYLLSSYYKYKQMQNNNVDTQTSCLILSILSEVLGDKNTVTPDQYRMMDKCGPLLCKGILSALDGLKNYPDEVWQLAYTVLYQQYLHEDGPAISVEQVQQRLFQCGVEISVDKITRYIEAGERMATALIFEHKVLNASILAHFI